MTHRDYVLSAIHHEETDKVPYTLAFEGGVDGELDAHYGSRRWRSRVQDCMDTVAHVDSVAEETVDGDHLLDAFGTLWRTDQRPFHLEKPGLPEPRIDLIEWPTIDRFQRTIEPDMEKRTGPSAAKFSIAYNGWGLLEQSWRIRGFENMMVDTIVEPDFFEEMLDRLTELRLGMVEKLKDIPADAIMFGDDWGDQRGVIIGPERWRRYFKPRWAKVYEAVHAQGKYVISHCCGSIEEIMADIIEIGLDVLESVQPEPSGMNPFELKKKYGDKITFWGCLGSQSTIPFGTPQRIRDEVARLCREMGRGGGFILAPAKALQPETPTENAVAVLESFTEQSL